MRYDSFFFFERKGGRAGQGRVRMGWVVKGVSNG